MAMSRFFSKAPKSSLLSSMTRPATPTTASFERMGTYRHDASSKVSVVAPARSLLAATHTATATSLCAVSSSSCASPHPSRASKTRGAESVPSSRLRYMTTGRLRIFMISAAAVSKHWPTVAAACSSRLLSSSTSVRYARKALARTWRLMRMVSEEATSVPASINANIMEAEAP